MKIPQHVAGLARAVEDFIRTAVDHDDYVSHASPQSSIDAALGRAEIAKIALDGAVEAYVCAEERSA